MTSAPLAESRALDLESLRAYYATIHDPASSYEQANDCVNRIVDAWPAIEAEIVALRAANAPKPKCRTMSCDQPMLDERIGFCFECHKGVVMGLAKADIEQRAELTRLRAIEAAAKHVIDRWDVVPEPLGDSEHVAQWHYFMNEDMERLLDAIEPDTKPQTQEER